MSDTNNRIFGYLRLKEILAAISLYECLTTEQLYLMYFKNLHYGLKKAQERLRKLYQTKQVSRIRYDIHQPSVYFIGKKPQNLTHRINRNWGILHLLHCVKTEYEKVEYFEPEYKTETLQADGFFQLTNYVTGKNRFWFIESDITASKNNFTKIEAYNGLYLKGLFRKEWWVTKSEKFPKILIVTDSTSKANHIKKLIDRQNQAKLVFEVLTVDNIRNQLTETANITK